MTAGRRTGHSRDETPISVIQCRVVSAKRNAHKEPKWTQWAAFIYTCGHTYVYIHVTIIREKIDLKVGGA